MGDFVNSKQVQFNKSYVSCGVLEAHHLPDESPVNTMFAICNALYNKANGRPSAFVLFSDAVDTAHSRGEKLAKELEGTGAALQTSQRVVNPKSGHVIQVWMWTVDHEKFRKWYVEEYANRIEEQ